MGFIEYLFVFLISLIVLVPIGIHFYTIIKLNNADREVFNNYSIKIKNRKYSLFILLILAISYILLKNDSIIIAFFYIIVFVVVIFLLLIVFPYKDYKFYKNNISSKVFINSLKIRLLINIIGVVLAIVFTFNFLILDN